MTAVQHKMILTGDINLMGVDDPAVPFAKIAPVLHAADVVFANLECCFYEPEVERSVDDEGFYAYRSVAEALRIAGIHAVGNANNVNYGAPAIRSSLSALDALDIPHAGAGLNREDAHEPVVLERDGIRYGFLQRTSVFWSRGHEATDDYPGVATIKGHTAYRPRHEEMRSLTRPGMAPEVVTWAEPGHLERFQDDIAALRRRADVVVASNHWGLDKEVLQYQRDIAHAAIDAGADVVMGHGPHVPLPMEFYKNKPIYYGLGSFSFETGHGALKHPDWIGMFARLSVEDGGITEAAFSFVRHNAGNETILRAIAEEQEEFEDLKDLSAPLGVMLREDGDVALIRPAA